MEIQDKKNFVPELKLEKLDEKFKEMNKRSNYEEFSLPSSLGSNDFMNDHENIRMIMKGLNAGIENVLENIGKSCEIDEVNKKKLFLSEELHGDLDFIEQTEEKSIESLAENSQFGFQNPIDMNWKTSHHLKQHILCELQKFRESALLLKDKTLESSLEKSIGLIKYYEDPESESSFYSDDSDLQTFLDEEYRKRSKKVIPRRENYLSLEKKITNYENIIQRFGQDIFNLISIDLPVSFKECDALLDDYFKGIVKVLAGNLAEIHEKKINGEKNCIPSILLSNNLQVACSYEEVLSIHSRISEIIDELSENKLETEYFIQVGLLKIGITVYFSENHLAKYYSLPLFYKNFGEIHIKTFEESIKTLKKGMLATINAISDRGIPQKKSEKMHPVDYVEEIIKLKNKIINLEEIINMNQESFDEISKTAEAQIKELENLIDKKCFEIEMLNNKLNYLQNNECTEESEVRKVVHKKYSLKEKEKILNEILKKIDIEAQKLELKRIEYIKFQQEKQEYIEKKSKASETNKKGFEENLKTLSINEKKSLIIEIKPESLEKSTQTPNEFKSPHENASYCENTPETIFHNRVKLSNITHSILNLQTPLLSDKSTSRLSTTFDKYNEKENSLIFTEESDLLNLSNEQKNFECLDFEDEKKKILDDKIVLNKQRKEFEKKLTKLKEKIVEVNNRQKVLSDAEKEINEKKTKLQVQSKKQEFYKQAIDEEWERIDKKRSQVLKCQKIIDSEWENLIEQISLFEDFKKTCEFH